MFRRFFNKSKNKPGVTKSDADKSADKSDMNKFIRNTFLKLTSNTYPYGFEEDLVKELIESKLFPSDIQKDRFGNYFYKIGESRTVFTSHLDTACKDSTSVIHVIKNNIIRTDGKTILGADDKAGVSIMLYMMKHNIPGVYYFFIGEEVGCVGSRQAATIASDFRGKYDRMISFDRRSTDSVITYQSSTRCCSDEFANNLASELNKSGLKYKKDDTGVYTDSAEFVDIISECTNLSVGYYGEHTVNESQDISHLEKLADACLKVNWENLVTKRDPSKTEYKSYGRDYSSYTGRNFGKNNFSNHDYGWGSDWNSRKNRATYKKTYAYHDDFYEEDDFKKTRRSGKKNKQRGKTYYDNGGELIEINKSGVTGKTFTDKEEYYDYVKEKYNGHNTNYYEWIKVKFLEDKLTREELDIVKDQYLDMNNESDRKFYDILVSHLFN